MLHIYIYIYDISSLRVKLVHKEDVTCECRHDSTVLEEDLIMDTWVYFPPRIQHKVLLQRPEQPLLGPTMNSLSAVHTHARYLH